MNGAGDALPRNMQPAVERTLPEPRPVLWPLRDVSTAAITVERLPDGRRRIVIRHRELRGVTPRMLAWWYRNVPGDMSYAGGVWPRYLVWHPLDHISYEVVRAARGGGIGPGARLRIQEAFQRRPERRMDLRVQVARIDEQEAIIERRVLGVTVLQLVNRFAATADGAGYTTVMTIGVASWLGRLVNPLLTRRILGGERAMHWARHHVEEIGNLENFLPALVPFASPAERVAASGSS